jgi:hypothetical protein
MKKNYQTSEFWFTVVTIVFSTLYLMGFISDYSQKEELISDISHGVESVFLVGGQLFVLSKYIRSRNEQKKAQVDLEMAKEISRQVELELAKREKQKEENDDKHRIDYDGSSETDTDSQG